MIEGTDMIENVARAIIGPHDPLPAGRAPYTLEKLREIRWEQAGRDGQAVAMREAKAAIAAMQQAQQWQGIESAPSGIPIIGLRDPSQTGRQPAFIGEVYDLRKNALIDVWSGRWAVCTHWMPLPTPPNGGSDAE